MTLPTVTIDKYMGRKLRVLIGLNNANPNKDSKIVTEENYIGSGNEARNSDPGLLFDCKDP